MSSARAALPQLSMPEHLKCTISTCTPQVSRDLDRLLDRFDHLVRFIADMGEVAGVVALHHVTERDHLVRLRVGAGRGEQAGRHPERAGRERLLQQRDHRLSSSAVGGRSSMPITIRRSVLWPTSMPAFTAVAGKLSR